MPSALSFPTTIDRTDSLCRQPSQPALEVQRMVRLHGYQNHHGEVGVLSTGLRVHPLRARHLCAVMVRA
jgi:hypothetical protein